MLELTQLLLDINTALNAAGANFGVVTISGTTAGTDFEELLALTSGNRRRPLVVVLDRSGYEYCAVREAEYPLSSVRLLIAVGEPEGFPHVRCLVACGGDVLYLPHPEEFSEMIGAFKLRVQAASKPLWGVV